MTAAFGGLFAHLLKLFFEPAPFVLRLQPGKVRLDDQFVALRGQPVQQFLEFLVRSHDDLRPGSSGHCAVAGQGSLGSHALLAALIGLKPRASGS